MTKKECMALAQIIAEHEYAAASAAADEANRGTVPASDDTQEYDASEIF